MKFSMMKKKFSFGPKPKKRHLHPPFFRSQNSHDEGKKMKEIDETNTGTVRLNVNDIVLGRNPATTSEGPS